MRLTRGEGRERGRAQGQRASAENQSAIRAPVTPHNPKSDRPNTIRSAAQYGATVAASLDKREQASCACVRVRVRVRRCWVRTIGRDVSERDRADENDNASEGHLELRSRDDITKSLTSASDRKQ